LHRQRPHLRNDRTTAPRPAAPKLSGVRLGQLGRCGCFSFLHTRTRRAGGRQCALPRGLAQRIRELAGTHARAPTPGTHSLRLSNQAARFLAGGPTLKSQLPTCRAGSSQKQLGADYRRELGRHPGLRCRKPDPRAQLEPVRGWLPAVPTAPSCAGRCTFASQRGWATETPARLDQAGTASAAAAIIYYDPDPPPAAMPLGYGPAACRSPAG